MAKESVKRSRPGNPSVRHGNQVGPDYPEGRRIAPWQGGEGGEGAPNHTFGDRDDKAICSENSVHFDHAGLPIHEGRYNELWEGK